MKQNYGDNKQFAHSYNLSRNRIFSYFKLDK